MGNLFKTALDRLNRFSNRNKNKRILLLGYDNAGKTTMVYKLSKNEIVNTIPTIGFNVETVTMKNKIKFTFWDVSG